MSLRDLPVRGKLFAALAVPTAAFLALGILSGTTWLSNAASYGRDVTAAKLGRDVTATVHELQLERDLAAGFISSGRGTDPETSLTGRLDGQQRAVDAAVGRFRGTLRSSVGDLGAGTGRVADRVEGDLAGLPALRRSVQTGGLSTDAIFHQYSTTITDLLGLDDRIGQDRDDEDLRYAATVLNDVSTLKEIDSEIRGELFATSFAQRFAFGASDRLAGLLAQEQAAQDGFRAAARPDDRARFDQIVNGQAVLTVKRISERAIQRQRLTDLDIDPDQWFAASTTHIELLRTVESDLLDNVTHSARHLRSDAWQRTALIGALILVIIVGAIGWTLLIARTMTVPLRRLRSGALDVAQVRLPRLISELQTANPEQVDTTIRPIGVDSRDEIGEVARTFDELQREAVRLAAEQASLRRNVNTLFLSLSRRSQSLIERQIALIDRLEAAEENPLQLENLFRLDHLATRMRRNSENLLVLAGTGPGRRRAGPVPLGDVLQAALGEIEQYERIQIIDVPDARIAADSVNHVVHLVAELLENAAQFSPPYLSVDLAAALDDGGVLITIDDGGLGMSERELVAVNQRLADPPLFDFSIAQRLGLFVVARLADRHDIEVRLSRSDAGGVRASVRLPEALLVAPGSAAEARPPAPARREQLPGTALSGAELTRLGLPGAPPAPLADLPPVTSRRAPLAAPAPHPGTPLIDGTITDGSADPLPRRAVRNGRNPAFGDGSAAFGHGSTAFGRGSAAFGDGSAAFGDTSPSSDASSFGAGPGFGRIPASGEESASDGFAPYTPTGEWFRPRGIDLTNEDLADLADLAGRGGVDQPTGSSAGGPAATPPAGDGAGLPSIAQAVAALDRRRERAALGRAHAGAAQPDPSAAEDAAPAVQPAPAIATAPAEVSTAAEPAPAAATAATTAAATTAAATAADASTAAEPTRGTAAEPAAPSAPDGSDVGADLAMPATRLPAFPAVPAPTHHPAWAVVAAAASPAAVSPAGPPPAGLWAQLADAAGLQSPVLDESAEPFNWFVRDELAVAPGQAIPAAGRVNGVERWAPEPFAAPRAFDAGPLAGSRPLPGSAGTADPFGGPGLVAVPEPPAVPEPVAVPESVVARAANPGRFAVPAREQAAGTGPFAASKPGLSSPRPGAGPGVGRTAGPTAGPRRTTTASGLPIRTPKTVPIPGQIPLGPPTGSAGGPAGPSVFLDSAAPSSAMPDPGVAPERIRGRLSRLYEGIHHARGTRPAAEDDGGGG